MQEKTHLYINIHNYNELMEKNTLSLLVLEKETMRFRKKLEIPELDGRNKSVNKLFGQTRNMTSINSNLSKLYL